ncbi:MAG TPA: FAD/NAD(P)-binding protein [Gammaproteobacteria bacterium]
MYDIAIIGGGFSGTALAVQCLRRARGRPLRLALMERRRELGRGVAYGTDSSAHLLNVPAGRMSMLPEIPDDFLRYIAARDVMAAPGSFIWRSLYGAYLHARLQEAAADAAPAQLTRFDAEAVDVADGDGRCRISLADGRTLDAARLVLANGNQPPARLPGLSEEFAADPRYVEDPWKAGALEHVPLDRPVLLVGTGLTMADVAMDLKRRGMVAPMVAVSRRGLLPRAHRHHAGPALEPAVLLQLLQGGPAELRRYLRITRLCVAELAERGIDWRDVLSSLRPATARLWQSLPDSERRRFLRHLQPYWDVHRHRLAPEAAEVLERLQQDGQLQVEAARITRLEVAGSGLLAEWRPRHRQPPRSVQVGSVVNCTGPETRLDRSTDPLLRRLTRQGLLVPDDLQLGVQVDGHGALLDSQGRVSDRLFYLGPLLRARDWECTAVPELAVQAQRLAERLLAGLTTLQPALA